MTDNVHKTNDSNKFQNNNNDSFPIDKKEKEIQKYIELLLQIYLLYEKMKIK